MPFQNACFLSYRNSQNPVAQQIISKLIEKLTGQIELYMSDSSVYVDRVRLRGGDVYDPMLSTELCRSGCMVLIFNPSYFDRSHPFCTREFMAMVELERQRLRTAAPPLQNQGLIIPVILRGGGLLPPVIQERSPIHFDRDLLRPQDFNTRQALEKLASVAEQVFKRCMMLRRLGAAPATDCGTYRMPTDEQARSWLEQAELARPRGELPF